MLPVISAYYYGEVNSNQEKYRPFHEFTFAGRLTLIGNMVMKLLEKDELEQVSGGFFFGWFWQKLQNKLDKLFPPVTPPPAAPPVVKPPVVKPPVAPGINGSTWG